MKRIFYLSLFMWVSSILSITYAQDRHIKHFGVEDGLSNNYVVDITQDQNGYLWIATEAGLNRFNGNDFTIYNKSNSGLSSNELNTLLADPNENKIWIGTQRDGLCYFDPKTETINRLKVKGMLTSDITQLLPANDGGIWIVHYHLGIDHYNPKSEKFTTYSTDNVKGLSGCNWVAADDGNGNLYVGHTNEGLSIISLENRTACNFRYDPNNPNSIPGNEVRSICIDRNMNIWIGTDKGLALFNSQNKRFTVFRHEMEKPNSLLPGTVMNIKELKNGDLWIATNMGGVSILSLKNNTFTNPAQANFQNIITSEDGYGLSGPFARCIHQDTFGNIWIGNYRSGLDFISYESDLFKTLNYAGEIQGRMKHKQVWGLCMGHDGRIWIGGENELAVYERKNGVKTIPLPVTQTHLQTYIASIFEDSRHRIWLGTSETGAFVYNPANESFKHIETVGNIITEVSCFYEDCNNKLWIGGKNGLFSYSDSEQKIIFEQKLTQQLPDNIVRSILKDKKGKLWVGTFGKGVTIFDKEGKFATNFVTDSGFPSNAVNSMIQDSRGRIWVATREGIVLFPDIDNPSLYEVFSMKEGLNNSQVRAISEDHEGYIWISTNGGISRLDESTKQFYNYIHQDGVPLGDFMDGSVCISQDGMLFFGSQNGVCYFDPQRFCSIQAVSPVTITQFSVFSSQTESKNIGLAIPLSSGIVELTHEQNTFKIYFNVLDYTQSPQVEFAYMLEGLENVWHNTQGENQVIFRNIPPGKYKFKVKTRFRNQEWEDSIASLTVEINPPLWLTWYAKSFYTILIVAIIYFLLSFYKRKLDLESSLEVERKNSQNEQELNNERLRFYTNITHELRTPLTLILGPLEDLLSDTSLSPTHSNKIHIIHDSSTRLLNLINRILEFRKTETQNRKLSIAKGNLSQLVQETGLRYKELNQNPKVKFNVNIHTEITELFFDAEILTIIMDNLLSNAIKYTSQGEITLSLNSIQEEDIEYTVISISDTGHGISSEALPHIFDRYYQANNKYQVSGSGIGLALVKSLAELHEAILDVVSEQEVGTTFTLKLLTKNTYPNIDHATATPQIEEDTIDMQDNKSALILVVEDNKDICEYIKSSFTDIYEVITAKNGKEGWELAQSHIPNVIISDIMMPEMDGIELCQLVKDNMPTSHIPVILLTAKDSLREKEVGYAAGADSYLTKPFSAKLLHSRINNLLEARKKIALQLTSNITPKQEDIVGVLNKLDNEFVQRITQIIEDNLEMEKMDIAFIAEKMCMSHSTLYRKIKGVADMSVNEFIRKIKMKNSLKLLQSGEHTISEISYMIGFSSVAYFRQCFKSEFGMAPSEYIKQKK